MVRKFLSLAKKNNSVFLRFILAGGVFAATDVLFLFILVDYFHIWYLASATISFSLITLFGFFIQKKFTFRDSSVTSKAQFLKFSIISIAGLLLNAIFIYLFVRTIGLWYIFANLLTKVIVLLWNYLANKKITFKSINKND
jgi:putative flippase GtrA